MVREICIYWWENYQGLMQNVCSRARHRTHLPWHQVLSIWTTRPPGISEKKHTAYIAGLCRYTTLTHLFQIVERWKSLESQKMKMSKKGKEFLSPDIFLRIFRWGDLEPNNSCLKNNTGQSNWQGPKIYPWISAPPCNANLMSCSLQVDHHASPLSDQSQRDNGQDDLTNSFHPDGLRKEGERWTCECPIFLFCTNIVVDRAWQISIYSQIVISIYSKLSYQFEISHNCSEPRQCKQQPRGRRHATER